MMNAGEAMNQTWVTFCDVERKLISITRTTQFESWAFSRLDKKISSLDGKFRVFIDPKSGEDLRFEIELGVDQRPDVVHNDFNMDLLGSQTLWPGYGAVPTADWGGSYIWWQSGNPWKRQRPLHWEKLEKKFW